MQPEKVLMLASVASMIDQFNMQNIRLLQEMGYEVHVACNFKEGNTCDVRRILEFRQELENMRAPWHQWDCPRCIRPLCGCVRAYRQLQRLLQEHAFAWMHCHSPVGGALARAAAHRAGIPVIYTAHGFHFYKDAPLKNWLLYYPPEWLLSHWTDVLVTVNKEDYRLAVQRLKAADIFYIPGVGIDSRKFMQAQHIRQAADGKCRSIRTEYRIPQDAVLLLSVGELSRRKNHQAVIAALAQLVRRDKKDVYYLICGQGELKETLLRQAERLGVARHVRMAGFQKDVRAFYQAADVFVFPSLQEGMPAALMEAMASGLACAVSDIRGNRELIDSVIPFAAAGNRKQAYKNGGSIRRQAYENGGGIRFDSRKPHQLAEALEMLIESKELRESCAAYNRKKISAYDLDAVGRRMKKIYSKFACMPAADGPEISVIMPVYNTPAGQLAAAADSIRRQTWTDWELIIFDDGSAEPVKEALKHTAGKDSRIRLMRSEKNRKAGHARNACIRASRGRYIAVMDADDISAADRLEKLRAFLESHPQAAFAGSRAEFFVKDIGDDGELYWYCEKPQAEDFLFSLPYVHASLMFRREALQKVHGYDGSKKAVRSEDYDLLLRMQAAGLYGCNLKDVLYYIRRDRAQQKRRKYRWRLREAYVKYRGFQRLGFMPRGLLYAAKPLAAGLLPQRARAALQKRYYAKKAGDITARTGRARAGNSRR